MNDSIYVAGTQLKDMPPEGGKTCLYKYFGGAKATFPFVNLQVNDSLGGRNYAKFFISRALSPVPPCR